MLIYEVALLSACITIFINYCIGKPGSEFSPYEIFSSYTVWLSKRRLIKLGLYSSYVNQLSANLSDKKKHEQIEILNDFNRILYNAANEFFTWERMIGMCSICTGFWVSLATGFFFTQNFVYLVSIVVISHVLIRLINKII